jgi:hypothetical protein
MTTMRPAAIALAALVLCAGRVSGQATTAAAGDSAKAWAFSASAYTYFVPESSDYVQPTFTADRGWLHLEARYNYEDLETGSAFVGVTFGGGKKVAWELTPMVGGVFGGTSGVAPGYKGSLSFWKIEMYSEGEYVFDAKDATANFFYNWSETTLSPTEWFRFGVAAQRTRAYQTDRDIQRGVMVGFTYKRFDVACYVFNPDEPKPTAVVALRVGL